MALQHKINSDGDHQVGAKVDGVFVPFLTIPAFIVAQKVEAAKAAADTDTDDDEKGGA